MNELLYRLHEHMESEYKLEEVEKKGMCRLDAKKELEQLLPTEYRARKSPSSSS